MPAEYVNVRLRADTARELAAEAPSRHVLTTAAQRELLDGLRDALTGSAMPTEDEPHDVLIGELYLHGPDHQYRWAVRSTCGVVKVWSSRDRCMLAVNPSAARMIGRLFATTMEAAADATDSASRGGPRGLQEVSMRAEDAPEIRGANTAAAELARRVEAAISHVQGAALSMPRRTARGEVTFDVHLGGALGARSARVVVSVDG